MLVLSEVEKESLLFLKSIGKDKRVNIPKWVKDVVFFWLEDDVSCVIETYQVYLLDKKKENYNHIAPLNVFDLNDVTNIQCL